MIATAEGPFIAAFAGVICLIMSTGLWPLRRPRGTEFYRWSVRPVWLVTLGLALLLGAFVWVLFV